MEHQAALAKLVQRHKRRTDNQRTANQSEIAHHTTSTSSPADILFSRQRAQTSISTQIFDSETPISSTTLAESTKKASQTTTTFRSDSPSSQEHSGRSREPPIRTDSSNSDRPDARDANWPNVFRRNGSEKDKGKRTMTKEQYEALESDMEGGAFCLIHTPCLQFDDRTHITCQS
jgi:hypothetical protein